VACAATVRAQWLGIRPGRRNLQRPQLAEMAASALVSHQKNLQLARHRDSLCYRMLVGRTRAIVLVAVAALIGNAYCFATCASTACASTKTPCNNCHHQQSSHENGARCPHQHTEFAAPEAGIPKMNDATAAAMLPTPPASSDTISPEPDFLSQSEVASSPGHPSRSLSVIRI
jgi:hypothetical protein